MTYKLIITNAALQDEQEAYDYYEGIQVGLGERFLEKVEKRYADLSKHPEFYSYSDENKIIRDVAVDDFPFLVIYEVSGVNVIVFAIHNTHKKSTM